MIVPIMTNKASGCCMKRRMMNRRNPTTHDPAARCAFVLVNCDLHVPLRVRVVSIIHARHIPHHASPISLTRSSPTMEMTTYEVLRRDLSTPQEKVLRADMEVAIIIWCCSHIMIAIRWAVRDEDIQIVRNLTNQCHGSISDVHECPLWHCGRSWCPWISVDHQPVDDCGLVCQHLNISRQLGTIGCILRKPYEIMIPPDPDNLHCGLCFQPRDEHPLQPFPLPHNGTIVWTDISSNDEEITRFTGRWELTVQVSGCDDLHSCSRSRGISVGRRW